MGIFDDLIPDQPEPAASSGGGLFGDLIPSESASPERSLRPMPRPESDEDEPPLQTLDETDDARSSRGFGRSTYDSGLVDRPNIPGAGDFANVGTVKEQLAEMRSRRVEQEEEEGQTVSDLGSRFARGASEVVASLPEAAALAGAGNPNASALFAKEEVDRAKEQIALAEERLAENPQMSAETRGRIEDVIAAERRKISAYEPLIDTAEGSLKPEPYERPLFKQGDRLREASLELFGTPDPSFDDRFVSKLSEGGGSLAGFVAVTIGTGLVGGATAGASVNASGMYRRARQEGATDEEAKVAAYIGALVGTSEVIPIGRALDMLPAKTRGRVTNALGRRLSDAFRTAGEEGAQEAITEIANNLIAKGVWNPEQDAFEGAGEAALIGAVLGGGLGAITSTRSSEDPERLSSPRLTETDRASPLPNATIDDGKAIIDDLLSGKPPAPSVAPEQVAAPDVGQPRSDASKRPEAVPNALHQPEAETALVRPDDLAKPQVQSNAPDIPGEDFSSEILPVLDENGRETGEFVRWDAASSRMQKVAPDAPPQVDTSPAAQPQALQEEIAPSEVPAPLEDPASAQVEAVSSPDDAPTASPEAGAFQDLIPEKPKKPGKETLRKRPVAYELKNRGLSVKPGSPLAFELGARGINARTHPGLFSTKGVTDWDNLPAEEWGDYRHQIGDDGNGYLDRQGVIDALESEMRGVPVRAGVQAELAEEQAARDAAEAEARFEAAEPDPEELDLSHIPEASVFIPYANEDISTPTERLDYVVSSVDTVLRETGIVDAVDPQTRQWIIDTLHERGGNVEDAVWWNLHREADGYAEQTPEPRVAEQPADRQAAGSGEPAPQIPGSAGRPEGQPAAEGQSTPVDPADRRADVGQAQEPATPEVSAPAGIDAARADLQAASNAFKALDGDKKIADPKGYMDAAMRRSKARKAYADALADQGGRIELKSETGTGAVITPRQDGKPGARITYFDGKGISGDTHHDTLQAAVRDALDQGYDIEAPGHMKAEKAKWGKAEAKPEVKKATLPELTSQPVTDQQHDQIEDYLERSIRSASSLSKQEQQRIDKTYAKNGTDDVSSSVRNGMVPLTEDLTVYRGEALDEVGGGLMSVTLSESTARNFGRVRKIVLKAGTPVYSPRSGISGGEILVDPKGINAGGTPDAKPATERTEAGEQVVIPGAEQSAERSAEARKADQRREMEARQQQSKARTTVPQDDAGPLFTPQSDLFDAPKTEPKGEVSEQKAKPSKTQERLTKILRDEWTAREDLPEDAHDDFIAATKRVQEARRALADESGEDTVKAALEEIEAGYKPKGEEPVQERTDQERVKKERIEDFGEKIGGARKDTAEKTGPRGKRPKSDSTPAWRKRYAVLQQVDLKNSGGMTGKFIIQDTKAGRAVRDGFSTKVFDSEAEAEEAIPLYEVARNHRVRSSKDGFSIDRVTGKKSHTFKDGFKTREEAMEYMAQNAVEIIETEMRLDDRIHPALEQALRDGEDRRKDGRDVSPKDFTEVFGFRGVEFGKWNNAAERQHILNQAFDSFLDLSEILGIPPKAISLNGDLALAFGARGSGLTGGRAHYERNYGVINLTKIQGAGALAHEWMHAADHYFGRQDGKASSEKITNERGDKVFDASSREKDYASHGFQYGSRSGVREEVRSAYKAVMQAIAKRKAEFKEDVSTREVIESRAAKNLDRELQSIRDDLAKEQRYGRKKAPATKAQLLKVDALIKQIKDGKLGEKVIAPSKSQSSFPPMFNEPVMKLAEVYKVVRGRQAYRKHQGRDTGPAVSIQYAIEAKLKADQFLADAKKQKVKEKTVASEFVSQAWILDRGRASGYWASNHELIARAFESYVYDRLLDIDARNDFLAYEKHNLLPEYQLLNVKPYPEGQEREIINSAFRKLFDTIKTEETDDGVRMYQAAAVARGHAPARRQASTFLEARAAVKEFQGETITNRDSGIDAVVSRNALDKMLSSKAVNSSETPTTHSMAVANADALFENAIHGWVKPDQKGEPSIVGIHRFFARMDKPDGGSSMVKLTVKETISGEKANPLYTIEAVEFLEDGASAATWVASAIKSDGMKLPDILSAEDILDIARDVEDFNSLGGKEQRAVDGRRADPAKLQALLPDLAARLKKLMIRGVDLSIDPDMAEQGAVEFGPEGIEILIGNTLDGMNTLNHEAIHILRQRGLFSDAEWSALASEAESRWMAEFDIEERYPDLSREAQIEEAIAEAFAAHTDGSAAQGRVKSIFAKIKRFFRALKEALTGQGIRKAEDIFEAVERGEVGAREGRVTGEELLSVKQQRPAAAVRKLKPEGVQATAVSTHSAAIPDDTRFERFRRLIQDRMLVLRRMTEATEKKAGQKIRKEDDPYFAEERYSGRVGYLLDEIEDKYTKPILDLISEVSLKITDHKGDVREGYEAVSLWLMARHAKERNAHIASINDQMPDGGSGLTNAEADAILKQAGANQAVLDQIGALTDKLGKEMITAREDAGLLSAQEAHIWRTMYKHYVPLQKFAEDDMYDGVVNDARTAMGRKYSVKGKEGQRALGRGSEAFDPLATLLTQAMEVTVRAEKNQVAKVMYNFAVRNPNPAMYEITQPETQRFYNKATGKVETRVVGPASRQLAENEMALKVGGKEYRITFKDPRLAEALGQLGTNEMGKVTSIASLFSRYFSTINTMLSPPFVIVNAFRDMMTAQVNLGAAGGDIQGKLRKAALRDWIKAAKGAHRGLSGKADTEYSKWFKEYSEAGGRIHFWKVDNPESQSLDFAKRVKRASRGKLARTASSLVLPSTRDNPALSIIENVNMSVDNAVRLATYAEARRNGWSKADAASLAKNLTVNFNRRGEIGATMNAWYPFANAAIQGSHVILKAMRSRQVQGIVGGMMLFGLANDLLAAMLSGEDEDGELEYDQLPSYVSERNIIVATPFSETGYVTIPLPYGYNVFFFAGQQMGKIFRGVKSPEEASGQLLKATVGAFSPISGESGFEFLAPTVLDFANEFDNNKDWLGRPIRPENPYGDYGPQSYKEFNASAPSRTVAQGLNTLTGGSPLEPGILDISPEYIDHFFKFMTGGAGRFAGRAYGLAERAAEGTLGETEAFEVPLARVLVTESGDFLNQSRYFEFREAVQEARAQAKLSEDTGHPMTQEMKDLNALWLVLRQTEKQRKLVRQQMDAIYANETLKARERENRLKPLKERRNEIYMRFNRRFIDKMGPQAE